MPPTRWTYDLDQARAGVVRIKAHWQSGVASADIEYEQPTNGPREAMALIRRMISVETIFQGPDDPQENN